jgi:hypothetical protein
MGNTVRKFSGYDDDEEWKPHTSNRNPKGKKSMSARTRRKLRNKRTIDDDGERDTSFHNR